MSQDIETLQTLSLSVIRPDPKQPRKHFSGLDELAASIRTDGSIEPIMVRPVDDGYMIVHGERRYRASELAGLSSITAIVRQLSESDAYRISALENIHRNNLTAVEEARVYQHYIGDGMTQADVGKIFGKTQSVISHKLSLLELNEGLSYYMETDTLKEAHIRQLMKLKGIYGAGLTRNLCEWRGDCKNPDAFTESIKEWGLLHLVGVHEYEEGETPSETWHDINKLRPLEKLGYFSPEPTRTLIKDAYTRFRHYVSRHKYVVPQWEIAGFWFASVVVNCAYSVGQLATMINAFKARYESYLWWWGSYGGFEKTPHDNRKKAAMFWAYYGDLRHSGSIDEKTGLLKDEAVIDNHPDGFDIMNNNLRRSYWIVPSGLAPVGEGWDDEEGKHHDSYYPEHIAALYEKGLPVKKDLEELHKWGITHPIENGGPYFVDDTEEE